MEKQTGSAGSAITKQGPSDTVRGEQSGSRHHSLAHHVTCALHTAKQSAIRLSQHLWLHSSLPFQLLAASWLLTNVMLPLLLINHPMARSTLAHALAAVSGSLLLYHALGDGPFLFASFLSLLPLLVPHMPAAIVEVEGRILIVLPQLLFPRLLPLWRQLQLVVNTLVVVAVVEQIRRHVAVGRKRAQDGMETNARLEVPVVGREVREGEWELSVSLTVRTRRVGKQEDAMDTELEEAEEGADEKQRQQQLQSQQQEYSPEEKREREEAEYPRAPPSSPADFPLKMKLAVKKEGGGSQSHSDSRAAEEEGRGELQSPRPRENSTGWDVKQLRRALDPLAAEHQCFKPSSEAIAASHGNPLLRAEQQQQQRQQGQAGRKEYTM